MIDNNKIPATYANIVPATPKSRHPRNAIVTLFQALNSEKKEKNENNEPFLVKKKSNETVWLIVDWLRPYY